MKFKNHSAPNSRKVGPLLEQTGAPLSGAGEYDQTRAAWGGLFGDQPECEEAGLGGWRGDGA